MIPKSFERLIASNHQKRFSNVIINIEIVYQLLNIVDSQYNNIDGVLNIDYAREKK